MTTRSDVLRFGDGDLQALGRLLVSPSLRSSGCARLRSLAMSPPIARGEAALSALSSLSIYAATPPESPAIGWSASVCKNREIFHGAIFLQTLAEGATAFVLLIAVKSPYQANLLQLRVAPPVLPHLSSCLSEDVLGSCASWHDHRLECAATDYVQEDGVLFDEGHPIRVLMFASVRSLPEVVADGEAELLSDIVGSLPKKPSKTAPKHAPPKKFPISGAAGVIAQYPWAAEYLNDRTAPSSSSGSRRMDNCGDRPEEEDDEPAEELAEEQIEQVWETLAGKRRDLAEQVGAGGGADFKSDVRGGIWIEANKGFAADAMMEEAQNKAAAQWARSYNINKMVSFSIRKYGDHTASMLAIEWAREAQYFFDLWKQQRRQTYQFTEDDIVGYTPGPRWEAFYASLTGAALTRATGIVMMAPRARG